MSLERHKGELMKIELPFLGELLYIFFMWKTELCSLKSCQAGYLTIRSKQSWAGHSKVFKFKFILLAILFLYTLI